MPSKRQSERMDSNTARAKRRKQNPFIDDRAGVDHEEEEEEGEGEGEGWLVHDSEEESDDAGIPGDLNARRNDEMPGPNVTRDDEGNDDDGQDMNRLSEAVQRICPWGDDWEVGRLHHPRWEAIEESLALDDMLKESDRLWEVGCMHGEEDLAVFRIMRRALNPKYPVVAAPLAFSNPNLGGRIFIDAETRSCVVETIKGIPGVRKSTISLIPRKLYERTVEVRGRTSPRVGEWVVLRPSTHVPKRHAGDYAFVASEGQSGTDTAESFVLVCVPRRKAGQQHLVDEVELEKLKREATAVVYEDEQGDGTTIEGFRIGKPCVTTDGLLCLGRLDHTSFTYMLDEVPDHETVHFFLKSNFLPALSRLQMVVQRQTQDLQIGQRVMLSDHAFQKRSGTIVSAREGSATVLITSLDLEVDVPLKHLWPYFQMGDVVEVRAGYYAGCQGWVLEVDDMGLEIWLDKTEAKVTLEPVNITFSDFDYSLVNLYDLEAEKDKKDYAHRLQNREMRTNENRRYIGKNVIITGAHQYKGRKGRILDVSLEGMATMELRSMGSMLTKVHLDFLRMLRPDDKMGTGLRFKGKAAPVEQADVRSLMAGPSSSDSEGATPIPERDDGASSPTWRVDAGDREGFVPPPFPTDVRKDAIGFAWMLHPNRSKNMRVPVRQVASEDGTPYNTGRQEIIEVGDDGQRIKIQGTGPSCWVRASDVRTLLPARLRIAGPATTVTPIHPDHEHFGRLFTVLEVYYEIMQVRRPGQRLGKSNAGIHARIEDWAVVLTRK